MKKILGLFFSVLVLLMMIPTAAAETNGIKVYESFTYQVTDTKEVVILHCDKEVSGDITVPETIDGLPVTVLGPQAFESCRGITGITLPSSLRHIGFLAFWECSSLKKITIPDCPVSIESNILSDTPFYKDQANWKDGALYIGKHLIRTNAAVSGNFKVKDSTITVAGGAFKDSKKISKITIPDSVEVIGNDALNQTAFYGNKANWKNNALYVGKHLIEVKDSAKGDFKIKDGTLTIADGAFDFCKKIKSVEIPDSVTKISEKAFDYCSSLEKVNISRNITFVGEFAFEGCKALKELNYDGVVTDFDEIKISRGNEAIDGCVKTKAIEYKKDADGNLLNFIYEVEDNAITVVYCDPATVGSVTIPETIENLPVKKIAEGAFKDCSIVNEINLPKSLETIEKSAFENCGIIEIKIPEKVEYIEENVFSGCVALETVELHSGVKKIDQDAFKGCFSLVEILYKADEVSWSKIVIHESNGSIKGASVTYNATGTDSLDLHSLILPASVGGGLALIIVVVVIIINAVKKRKSK